MQILDTNGERRYISSTRFYFKTVDAILLAFDITDMYSFEYLVVIYQLIVDNIFREEENEEEQKQKLHQIYSKPIVIVGLKADLQHKR